MSLNGVFWAAFGSVLKDLRFGLRRVLVWGVTNKETPVKKLIGSVIVAASVAGLNVFACGGMTQIDPPSLQLNSNSVEAPVESVLEDLEENLVIC